MRLARQHVRRANPQGLSARQAVAKMTAKQGMPKPKEPTLKASPPPPAAIATFAGVWHEQKPKPKALHGTSGFAASAAASSVIGSSVGSSSVGKSSRRNLSTRAANPALQSALDKLALAARDGTAFGRSIEVGASRGTTFVTPIDVYATPKMIWDMEWHTRDILLEQLRASGAGEQWDSVGVTVEFEHGAAAPVGAQVHVETTVTRVEPEGRRVAVATVFSDAVGELGRGKHERVLVDMGKIRKRIASRKEEIEAAEAVASGIL